MFFYDAHVYPINRLSHYNIGEYERLFEEVGLLLYIDDEAILTYAFTLDEDIESHLVTRIKYSLLVRVEDLDKYKEKSSLSRLKDFNFKVVENYYYFNEFFKTNDIHNNNLLKVSSIGATVRLVKKRLGISLITELYTRNYTNPKVTSVKLKYDLFGPDLFLNYMKLQNIPLVIEDFITEIKEKLNGLSPFQFRKQAI